MADMTMPMQFGPGGLFGDMPIAIVQGHVPIAKKEQASHGAAQPIGKNPGRKLQSNHGNTIAKSAVGTSHLGKRILTSYRGGRGFQKRNRQAYKCGLKSASGKDMGLKDLFKTACNKLNAQHWENTFHALPITNKQRDGGFMEINQELTRSRAAQAIIAEDWRRMSLCSE